VNTSETNVHPGEQHSDQVGESLVREILNEMPPEERNRLAYQLQPNGGTETAQASSAAVVHRYVQDLVTTSGNGTATLPLRLKEHVIGLLRLSLEASKNAADVEHVPEQERRRRDYLAQTARYVKEQQARNYVLPEDTTAMTTEQKDHLFDQVVAGRIAQTDEERRVENVAIFYRYIEVENGRDYVNMKKLFHPTQFCSKTYFGNDPISPEAHVRMLRGLFRAFPDWFMV
jgi:hypothetical protein